MNQNNLIDLQTGTTIKPGQRLIRIKGGVWLPVGIGSKYTPGSAGTQSATRYYKCASVDTSERTWTGYKAVLNDGVYTFEDTVTTGLSYTSMIPQVGSIYSADALVYVSSLYTGISTDGLVFYAPLAENKATAETGQTLNYTGNFQFNIVSGIPCAVFSGGEKISVDNSNYFSGDFSISCWFRLTTPMAEGVVNAAVFVFGTSGNWFTIRANASGIFMNLGGQSNTKQISIDTSSFNNITVTYSSTKLSIYINGLLDSQVDLNSLPDHDVFLLGDSGYSDWFTGEIAAFRIYSKVLSASEIAALASEFSLT